jgi:signal transduction histidine kinase/CheY-like chemotaxis protein
MSGPSPVSLGPHDLAAAFPFHFACDSDLVVTSVGGSLAKLCPALRAGVRWMEVLRVDRPSSSSTAEGLRRNLDEAHVLGDGTGRWRLRGQFVTPLSGGLVFLGSLWLEHADQLVALDLDTHDFAVHDPTIDHLLARQLQGIALDDAKRLAAKLSEHRAELRATNRSLALLHRTTQLLAEARTLEDVAPAVLEAVATEGGFALAALWLAAEDLSHLTCVACHGRGEGPWRATAEALRGTTVARGVGALASVWRSGEAATFEHTDPSTPHPRGALQAQAGVRAGLLLPVRVGSVVGGVLELGAQAPVALGDRLSELLQAVVTKVGLCVERQRAAADLVRARDRAEAAARAKSEFLANMSHELRTPMSAIIGLNALLLDTPLTAAQHELGAGVAGAASALLLLLDDLLDFSKIEAGDVELADEPLELRGVLRAAEQRVQSRAATKGLALQLRVDDDVPSWVRGDAIRLRQIVLNFLTNAVKFTDRGHVLLTAKVDDGVLVLEVIDTGPGIPAAQLPRLFQKFSQADTSTTRRFGGTGLGLAIAQELAALMGGTVGVHSVEGEGAQFWVRLPLRPAEPPTSALPSSAAEPEVPPGTRVLVVEDNVVNQRVAELMLRSLGCRVDLASSGGQAFERLGQARYDVVFLDWQMPDQDGLEVAREIRRGRAGDPTVPLVAVTANVMSGDRETCLAAGMDDYVPKPFTKSALAQAIARWRRRS